MSPNRQMTIYDIATTIISIGFDNLVTNINYDVAQKMAEEILKRSEIDICLMINEEDRELLEKEEA